MRALSEVALNLAEDNWIEYFTHQSQLFSDRAIFILERFSEIYPQETAKALKNVSSVWGILDSPLHFSHTFVMEEFSSHAAAYKEANNILYGQNKNHSILHLFRDRSSKERRSILTIPLTRLIVHWIFYLLALVCFGILVTTDIRMDTVNPLIIPVFMFVIGDSFEEFLLFIQKQERHWSVKRILLHFMDIWRCMDVLFFTLFFTVFFMHISRIEILYIHTRRIYSVALFLKFLRLLKILLMFKNLGIMVIMIKEMLKDLLKFLFVASVFMLAAGTVYHANTYPNHTFSSFSFDYWRFWKMLKIPYWQIFGELSLDTLEGSDSLECTNNESLWRTDPTVERCSQYDWLAVFIAAVYMMLVNWLLLNVVIAMFSTKYSKIHHKSEQTWRYHRNMLIIEHEYKIPSPLNLIFRVILVWTYIRQENNGYTTKEDKSEMSTIEMLEKQREIARLRIEQERNDNIC